LQLGSAGISTVSVPVQGALPTNLLSSVEVQHLWQMFPEETFDLSVFAALPANIRKPFNVSIHGPTSPKHMTYGLESGGLSAWDIVDIETSVVHQLSLRSTVSNLGHALVGAVLVLEKHDCGPVVGFVLGESAGSAGGLGGQVVCRVHSRVERVATNDLMEMGSVCHTGVDEGIDTVDDELRACESQHAALSCDILGENRDGGESSPLHYGENVE
jgi:hypothetical protein